MKELLRKKKELNWVVLRTLFVGEMRDEERVVICSQSDRHQLVILLVVLVMGLVSELAKRLKIGMMKLKWMFLGVTMSLLWVLWLKEGDILAQKSSQHQWKRASFLRLPSSLFLSLFLLLRAHQAHKNHHLNHLKKQKNL